jgi:CheY-like chemotaxis protein
MKPAGRDVIRPAGGSLFFMAIDPKKPSTPPSEVVTNTVRLKSADLAKLHQELDANSVQGRFRRTHFRWSFHNTGVKIEMQQPGGVSTTLAYACRNLSGTGLGILHNAYVHLGTKCVVHLPAVSGGTVGIPSKVMRCRHVRGLVHEVGIAFLTPINIREFIALDPMEGSFTLESVDAEKLSGSVMHIDDSPMDRRLVRHFLKDTSLNIVGVEDATQAMARVHEGFDLILCDFEMPDCSGPELVEKMRAAGVQTPVIMVSGDQREASREAARSAKVNAYVFKPIVKEKLLRAIAEFLVLETTGSDSGGALFSSLKPEDPTSNFVPEFVEELRTTANKLNKAVNDDDSAAIRRLCFQVKGASSGLGFKPIADAAEACMVTLAATMSVTESLKQVRNLISLCLRARARDGERKAG